MGETRRQLLAWIDTDRDRLIEFLCRFVQAKSPNPPGDTRAAAAHITGFLDTEELPYRIIDPKPEFPNIVGTFEGKSPGKHLVLNGHIDCFPLASTRPGPMVARGAVRSSTTKSGGAAWRT